MLPALILFGQRKEYLEIGIFSEWGFGGWGLGLGCGAWRNGEGCSDIVTASKESEEDSFENGSMKADFFPGDITASIHQRS